MEQRAVDNEESELNTEVDTGKGRKRKPPQKFSPSKPSCSKPSTSKPSTSKPASKATVSNTLVRSSQMSKQPKKNFPSTDDEEDEQVPLTSVSTVMKRLNENQKCSESMFDGLEFESPGT